jgi:hypothetical protein
MIVEEISLELFFRGTENFLKGGGMEWKVVDGSLWTFWKDLDVQGNSKVVWRKSWKVDFGDSTKFLMVREEKF